MEWKGMITGLFDIEERLEELRESGGQLVKLAEVVDWEGFRGVLAKAHEKERKAKSGSKAYDVVLTLKIEVLRSLYNSSCDVWADAAYASKEREERMKEGKWRAHIQRKGNRHRALSEREKRGNKTRARVRARVKICLRNLAYNMDRLRILTLQAA